MADNNRQSAANNKEAAIANRQPLRPEHNKKPPTTLNNGQQNPAAVNRTNGNGQQQTTNRLREKRLSIYVERVYEDRTASSKQAAIDNRQRLRPDHNKQQTSNDQQQAGNAISGYESMTAPNAIEDY
jgi:hypothetical protein